MKITRYVLLAAVTALTAASALADPPTGTRTATFPPVGLASSETAQVNLVNLASNPSSSSSNAAASCTGSVTFLDATGAAIGKATTFTVASGQIVSVKLPFSATAASGRTEFRASVALNVGEGAAACDLQSSLETYDSGTGVTHVFLSGPQAIVQPFFGRD